MFVQPHYITLKSKQGAKVIEIMTEFSANSNVLCKYTIQKNLKIQWCSNPQPPLWVYAIGMGWIQLLSHSNGGGQKTRRGGSFEFVTPSPKHEGKWLNCPR